VLRVFLRPDDDIRREVVGEALVRALRLAPDAVRVDVRDGVVTLSGQLDRSSDTAVAVVGGPVRSAVAALAALPAHAPSARYGTRGPRPCPMLRVGGGRRTRASLWLGPRQPRATRRPFIHASTTANSPDPGPRSPKNDRVIGSPTACHPGYPSSGVFAKVADDFDAYLDSLVIDPEMAADTWAEVTDSDLTDSWRRNRRGMAGQGTARMAFDRVAGGVRELVDTALCE
jgi:hypothetical protein